MENKEGFVDSLKRLFRFKRPGRNLIPDNLQPPLPSGWNYEIYREYLLALSRGRDYLLSIEEYPSRIELSEPWHEVFNQIRANPHEGWVVIGYQSGQRRLVLPRVAEKGLSHSVPHEVQKAALDKARTRAGITDLVGDAHSHPRLFTDLSWHIPSKETSDGEGSFSLGDIYGFLYDLTKQRPSDSKRSAMFVVEGNETIAAFATRGSLQLVRDNFSGTYEKFAKEWYERYGWNFIGMTQDSGEVVERSRGDASKFWQINKAVAHKYQLVLYRGFTNKPLLRDYPARSTI